MKKLTVLLFILLVCIGTGCSLFKKKKYFKNMPIGRWREVARMETDSSLYPFKDTMFIAFKARSTFNFHKKNGSIVKGTYAMENNNLNMGAVNFAVLQRKPGKLLLGDAMGYHRFVPDSSDTPVVIVITKEGKPNPVSNISQMIGHWQVYKRTVDKQLSSVDYTKQIRSAYITGISSDSNKLGYFYASLDQTEAPSWYIKDYNNTDQVLTCNGKDYRIIKVIKCQNREMILQGDGITYYFKQFD